jgi:ribonuclease BN (tRNA processing enzyme)
MSSAQVIIANDLPYIVDCANGVSRQLVLAGMALAKVRHVFVTHHHSDHNADYGILLLLAWASGLRTRVDTWGPPPLTKITQLFFEMSAPISTCASPMRDAFPSCPSFIPTRSRTTGR